MAQLFHLNRSDDYPRFTQFLKGNIALSESTREAVNQIITGIVSEKDRALIAFTKKFDGVNLKSDELLVSEEEIEASVNNLDNSQKDMLKASFERLWKFHEKQIPTSLTWKDEDSVTLGWIWQPIQSCGLYVPGGTATYPSSVLMMGVPARIAGVKSIALTVPPSNALDPHLLYASRLVSVDRIYRVGGAQAIAALAYGTETISAVDKIAGPGNSFVTEAKRQVFGQVGIDMVAGPTEVVVISDNNSRPDWVAADLIAQAEHDPLSRSILISDCEKFVSKVFSEVARQAELLPRKDIILQSWNSNGAGVIVDNIVQGIELSNEIAPEHLQLNLNDPERYLDRISNAGSVFLGNWTPEVLGDYIGGPNHVLPTSGTARFFSGLAVWDFMKRSTVLGVPEESFGKLGRIAEKMAVKEHLEGHANSIRIRMNEIEGSTNE
ncbi:MAG: histidinol dehydrogenase [Paracoccaceae bacterium]|nr:histidinol dehydrogenase [Paracoccaceae bacterium]MYG09308.1 histidinol dehydrogenase [Paracoccaceae bacterium]